MRSRPTSRVNWPVFGTSAALVTATAIWAGLAPEAASGVLASAVNWISANLGWFYISLATTVTVFVIVIAASRWGTIRLGPDHSRPQFSLFSWGSMLFAAGIGVDLLFFGVAEPVFQYYHPPTGAGGTVQAARDAVVLTIFHYGITGWSLYALMGMCLGYFAYRGGLPLTIRAALYPLVGKRIQGTLGHAVDVAAILGTVFGVATSLGIGVVQLNYGLTILFGIPETRSAQFALIVLAVAVATLSAVSGVDKGIKRLSELNVGLAIGLMVYILITGKTAQIFDGLVMNVGDYAASFLGLTLNTYAYDNATQWLGTWTLFFWAWWIAWAPFVGLFLARISKGRTLRQFVIGTLTLPFCFVLSWIAVFGNAAILRVLDGDAAFGQLTVDHPERGFYQLLQDYPGALFVAGLASAIGLLLYITSADSAALVTANLSSVATSADDDGPRWVRVFWAVTTGALTMAMLLVGGIPALQNATLVIGLPFAAVIVLVMIGLVKALRAETHLAASRTRSGLGSPGVDRGWGQRLAYAMSCPDEQAARRFVTTTASDSLTSVATQARELGLVGATSRVHDDESGLPAAELVIPLQGGDFVYRVVPVRRPMPSFALRISPESDVYYRLEVFSSTGALGHDIAGLSRDQVIADVLTLFECHLDYLERCQQPGLRERLRELEFVRTARERWQARKKLHDE